MSFHVGEAAHIVTDGRRRLNAMGRSQHIAEARQKMFLAGYDQWIGLRENLQETIDFPIKYGVSV